MEEPIMIQKIYLENYHAFNNRVELDLQADNRIKKFPDNVTKNNLLKSVIIYGPNNTGKTGFINGIRTIKEIILNETHIVLNNFFTGKKYSTLGIRFNDNNKYYNYEFKATIDKKIPYEKFSILKNDTEEIIFLKDRFHKTYKCKDKKLKNMLELTSDDNILIYTLNSENFVTLQEAKKILTNFAKKIEIVDMNNITDHNTIELLKNKNNISKKVVSFIKKADLFLDDFYYDEKGLLNDEMLDLIDEKFMKNKHFLDQIKLISVYKGYKVPSIMFDSVGTRKIVALASFIIDALENGKILVVDELDSSLHFKLTRAIISLFNNELNTKAQIICTVHDTDLLSIKTLFRKEQIWFTDKDNKGIILYSLKDFTYSEAGIRDTTDIYDKYSKGLLGAIPNPDLLASLFDDNNS